MEGQGPLSEEMFHSFLQLAVKRQASDVHFEVGYPPTYRVFGELLAAKYPPLTHADTEAIANFVLQAPGSGFTPLDFREVDRSYSLPGVSRFRASIFKQRGSWGAVMRTIPFQIPDFETLNLPAGRADHRRGAARARLRDGRDRERQVHHDRLAHQLHHPAGAAPRHHRGGSDRVHLRRAARGSSSSARSASDTASYTDALRAALRQDPDIIMVGELRDREAADICLKAAETGHLVITSLHTPDVPRAIGRLVGLFPAEEQDTVRARLADNLQAVRRAPAPHARRRDRAHPRRRGAPRDDHRARAHPRRVEDQRAQDLHGDGRLRPRHALASTSTCTGCTRRSGSPSTPRSPTRRTAPTSSAAS